MRESRLLLATIAFTAGAAVLQRLEQLPPNWIVFLLPTCGISWMLWNRGRVLMAGCLGFLWAGCLASFQQTMPLPSGLVAKDLVVEGVVKSLPVRLERSTRFVFAISEIREGGESYYFPHRIRLSWYSHPPELLPGDRWRLVVRLKPPHGFSNPGSFDYEKWLWQNAIRASGYVRDSPSNQHLSSDWWSEPSHRVRYALRERILEAMGPGRGGGLVIALALGDRSLLSREQWSDFTRTGTNHLVAISGLHIGIIAAMFWWLTRRTWAAIPALSLRIPSPGAGAIGAILGALAYAALAGFAIPTQRALIMLAIGFGCLLTRRSVSLLRVLCYALLAVLIMDPLAVLAGGFWLSFGAVAAILWVSSGHLGARSPWKKWGVVQIAVFIGLLPVLLLLFGQISLLAPLVNLLAVPWFSLVLVPAVLASVLAMLVFPNWGGIFLEWLQVPLEWTLETLQWLARSPFSVWVQAEPPIWVWPFAFCGAFLLLAPRGWPGRWLGVVALLPVLTFRPPGPAPGELWLTVLDVGQGGAAVLRTKGHTLVFDSGPRYSSGFDAGAAVVVPYLRNVGVREVDVLVLTNADSDHAGGAKSLMEELPVRTLLSGEPEELGLAGARACTSAQKWTWDGIELAMLHPDRPGVWTGNDASCVLRIETPGGASVLLTGDIEADAESDLVRRLGDGLRSNILLVPHHGSRTSSTAAFVSAVSPDFAVFSVGYLNRYGFPKPDVLEQWSSGGAAPVSTADAGAIHFELQRDGTLVGPSLYRESRRHYWSAPPFFAAEALQ